MTVITRKVGLKKALKEYSEEIYNQKANINTVLQLSPLIQTGQSELQGREIAKMNTFSKRIAIASVCIGIFSVLLATAAIYFSISNMRSSEEWKKYQLEKLDTIIQQGEIGKGDAI